MYLSYRVNLILFTFNYKWTGNENIHQLTKNNEYKLIVTTYKDSTDSPPLEASYSTFKLNNESDRYRLTIGGYSGNTGNYEWCLFFYGV